MKDKKVWNLTQAESEERFIYLDKEGARQAITELIAFQAETREILRTDPKNPNLRSDMMRARLGPRGLRALNNILKAR